MSCKLFFLAIFCSCTISCFGIQLESLSLEEKVGQLLMVHFNGEVANEDAKCLIQEIKVGGIIYYNWANGLNSPNQVKNLSLSLQNLAQQNVHPIPLIIATDQEGGIVTRLNHGFTQFPGNRALAETGDSNLAEEAALAMGKEMRSVGVNMNFAPVVDVNSNPRNPIIGIRAFSDHPETVVAFGEKALRGYKKANVMTTLKHFPGHGDVEVDSHESLPIVNKTLEELELVELFPFAKLASATDAVMTAHLLVPSLDPDNCSTLSEKTLSYLRNSIGFQGVIITDSLVMEGVLKKCDSVDEAAIQAFLAGCDILLLGGRQLLGDQGRLELTVKDIRRIHNNLVLAVKSGRISEARLNQSIGKILKLKAQYLGNNLLCKDKGTEFDRESHSKLSQKIASQALKIIKEPINVGSLQNKKFLVLAPQLLYEDLLQTTLFKESKSINSCFFKSLNPSSQEIESAKLLFMEADAFLIFSYNAWKNPSQAALIHSAVATKKPVVLVIARDPLDAQCFPDAHSIIVTFSPILPSLQAAIDVWKSWIP